MTFSSSFSLIMFLQLILFVSLFHVSFAGRKLTELVQEQPLLVYHKGQLLSGHTSVNLIWYGKFKPSQHSIIVDFISSLSARNNTTTAQTQQPSVLSWWNTIEIYYHLSSKKPLFLHLGKQILDENCSLGKSLTNNHLIQISARGEQRYAINVVLTSSDVAVEGFCVSRCGTHGWTRNQTMKNVHNNDYSKLPYIWVGNSETQCPGQCAWPFHQSIYGPQTTPLVSPNNDVGLDSMVINLGSLLAGTATNPFGNGYYQGSAEASLEAASVCHGPFGKGPGSSFTWEGDTIIGGGVNYGRKFVLPPLYDPRTHSCKKNC